MKVQGCWCLHRVRFTSLMRYPLYFEIPLSENASEPAGERRSRISTRGQLLFSWMASIGTSSKARRGVHSDRSRRTQESCFFDPHTGQAVPLDAERLAVRALRDEPGDSPNDGVAHPDIGDELSLLDLLAPRITD